MQHRIVRLAFVLGLLLHSTHASAEFIFDTQYRSVYASTIVGAVPGSWITNQQLAPNFAPFNATVSSTNPTYGGIATQHQSSTLLPNLISMTGEANVDNPTFGGTGAADTSGVLDVTFHVTSPTPVMLTASGVVEGFVGGPSSIRLIGPGGNLLFWFGEAQFPAVSGTRSTTVTLSPGDYRFEARLLSQDDRFVHTEVSSFDIQLAVVPEPAMLGAALAPLLALMRKQRSRTVRHN